MFARSIARGLRRETVATALESLFMVSRTDELYPGESVGFFNRFFRSMHYRSVCYSLAVIRGIADIVKLYESHWLSFFYNLLGIHFSCSASESIMHCMVMPSLQDSSNYTKTAPNSLSLLAGARANFCLFCSSLQISAADSHKPLIRL